MLAAVLALALYVCTGMIYGAVKAIREWATPLTPINYTLIGLASGALLASAGMAAMFAFVLGSALYRGLDISCGCFSTSTDKVSYITLIRAVVILLVSLGTYAATIFCPRRAEPRTPVPDNVIPAI